MLREGNSLFRTDHKRSSCGRKDARCFEEGRQLIYDHFPHLLFLLNINKNQRISATVSKTNTIWNSDVIDWPCVLTLMEIEIFLNFLFFKAFAKKCRLRRLQKLDVLASLHYSFNSWKQQSQENCWTFLKMSPYFFPSSSLYIKCLEWVYVF